LRAALVAIILVAPALASAQINPFRGRGADKLTGDDVRKVIETSDKLLARDRLPVGSSEEWKNDATGASGRVRVSNDLRRHGLACHTLAYEAKTRTGLAPKSTTLVWCRDKDGAWKIAS
jgi:surface antigen